MTCLADGRDDPMTCLADDPVTCLADKQTQHEQTTTEQENNHEPDMNKRELPKATLGAGKAATSSSYKYCSRLENGDGPVQGCDDSPNIDDKQIDSSDQPGEKPPGEIGTEISSEDKEYFDALVDNAVGIQNDSAEPNKVLSAPRKTDGR